MATSQVIRPALCKHLATGGAKSPPAAPKAMFMAELSITCLQSRPNSMPAMASATAKKMPLVRAAAPDPIGGCQIDLCAKRYVTGGRLSQI